MRGTMTDAPQPESSRISHRNGDARPEPNITGKYILDTDRNAIECPDFLEWGTWLEKTHRTGARDVGKTRIGEIEVSTMFLGLDHTWQQAEAQHAAVFTRRARGYLKKGDPLSPKSLYPFLSPAPIAPQKVKHSIDFSTFVTQWSVKHAVDWNEREVARARASRKRRSCSAHARPAGTLPSLSRPRNERGGDFHRRVQRNRS